MIWKMAGYAKIAATLLMIELLLPGGTLVVLALLLSGRTDEEDVMRNPPTALSSIVRVFRKALGRVKVFGVTRRLAFVPMGHRTGVVDEIDSPETSPPAHPRGDSAERYLTAAQRACGRCFATNMRG